MSARIIYWYIHAAVAKIYDRKSLLSNMGIDVVNRVVHVMFILIT